MASISYSSSPSSSSSSSSAPSPAACFSTVSVVALVAADDSAGFCGMVPDSASGSRSIASAISIMISVISKQRWKKRMRA
ncbi:hypothetical protein IE53DRAFT_270687 [Violaceomyces palustris]|uniref:Uncharacterized protein n=1 Tax=Violaceomyces palustris TaxID=1673888 RepID=A0ACD0P3K2_9BASI|nr:hypothetical protein IE53DRAFT_270687 [Violaceomyces palustris]